MLGDKKPNIRTSTGFSPVPADKYTVQILDVDYKMTKKYKSNEDEEKLNYKFVVLDDKEMVEGTKTRSTRGKYIWSAVSQSLNKKSWLYKLACAVYGRDLTKEEMDPEHKDFFNAESLVGKQVDVMVSVETSKTSGNSYNKVIGYFKNNKALKSWDNESEGIKTVDVKVAEIEDGSFLDDLDS